jgi:hypothetical protein
VFTDPATNQKWFAGGHIHGFQRPEGALLVALTHWALDVTILANFELLPTLPTVFIDWKDGSAGPFHKKEDWEGFLRGIRGTGLNVAVACHGGHGRTGTTLAIVGYLCGALKSPIREIRKKYCSRAVETESQVALVERITGVTENIKVRREYFNKWFAYLLEDAMQDGDTPVLREGDTEPISVVDNSEYEAKGVYNHNGKEWFIDTREESIKNSFVYELEDETTVRVANSAREQLVKENNRVLVERFYREDPNSLWAQIEEGLLIIDESGFTRRGTVPDYKEFCFDYYQDAWYAVVGIPPEIEIAGIPLTKRGAAHYREEKRLENEALATLKVEGYVDIKHSWARDKHKMSLAVYLDAVMPKHHWQPKGEGGIVIPNTNGKSL